jgi:hypothetical protein
MLERTALTPALGADETISTEQLIAHLRQWRADTAATSAALRAARPRVEEGFRKLENPKAAFEYVDFFGEMFDRVIADLDSVLSGLPSGFTPAHADLLRQIASNGAVEQRRTLLFRDKWVNKPLPYEDMRPLLTQLASDVRDQLADYKDLTLAAARLTEALAPPVPEAKPEERGLGRRELFSKLIKPLGEDDPKTP